MSLFTFGKKEIKIEARPAVKTVEELIGSFTKEFQKVADYQDKIVLKETQIIKDAERRKELAELEQKAANKFITNFVALSKDN